MPETVENQLAPYIIAFLKASQELLYFGTEHSPDPGNPQYAYLEKYWDEFLRENKGQPCVALVEGGERTLKASLKATISYQGEAGWVTWKAKEAHVPCISPEPSDKQITGKLLEQFNRDEVLHYYFMRDVVQWQRYKSRPSYKKYFWFVEEWADDFGWKDTDISIESLEAIHQRLVGHAFDPHNTELPESLASPYGDMPANKVAAACLKARDDYIAEQIINLWREGKSIFAVYGMVHVMAQEKQLRSALKKSTTETTQ